MDVAEADGKIKVDGRPLRVLHIGNIANNAFNIAKLQREAGIEADVLCYDYYHIMGSPEWEDARFEGDIGDQYFPKWHRVNLHGYTRPEWFIQGDFLSCVHYLIARNQGKTGQAAYYRFRMKLAQRQSWMVALFNLRSFLGAWTQPGYVAKKFGSAVMMPERVSQEITSTVCKKWPSVEPAAPYLRFASVSLAMLLAAFLVILGTILLIPVVVATTAVLAARRMVATLIREVREKPPPSKNLANKCLRAWAGWSRIPDAAVRVLADWLEQKLHNGWSHRFRGHAVLVMLVLPVYGLATLVLAMLAVTLLITAAPVVLFAKTIKLLLSLFPQPAARSGPDFSERCQELMRQWSALFPERPPLAAGELAPFQGTFDLLQNLMAHYDIVQGFATDAMWPLVCGKTPYVAYEHGTLRETPFQDNLMGKLTALAYRLSQHTFITNGDCRTPALRLGIERFSPALHGIDDSKFHRNLELREKLRKAYGVSRLYLCPIRHDWAIKGTDVHIRALPELVRRTGTDFRLIFIEWGEMVADSKALAESLGVAGQIVWIQPLPKRKLIDWIGAMDCVLDQMILKCFGATAPEAMGCGIPVIASFDPESTRWIIDEPAPMLSAFSPEQVVEHLARLVDPEFHALIAEKSLAWFRRNHSSKRSFEEHLHVYRELLAGDRRQSLAA